jgi:hypothetical protein
MTTFCILLGYSILSLASSPSLNSTPPTIGPPEPATLDKKPRR